MKILVVDDSSISRRLLIQKILEVQPTAIISQAKNGKEAVTLFECEKHALTFTDLSMPVMDGFEAITKILQIDKNAQIIAVSADRQDVTREKALNLGAKNLYNKALSSADITKVFQEDIQL